MAARTIVSEGQRRREMHAENIARMKKEEEERKQFMLENQEQIFNAIQVANAQKIAAQENDKSRAFSSSEAAKARSNSSANSAASRALQARAQDIGQQEFGQSMAFRQQERRDSLRAQAQARLDKNAGDRDARTERAFNTPGTKRVQTGAGTYRMVSNSDPDYKQEQHVQTEIQKRRNNRRKNFIKYF